MPLKLLKDLRKKRNQDGKFFGLSVYGNIRDPYAHHVSPKNQENVELTFKSMVRDLYTARDEVEDIWHLIWKNSCMKTYKT